MSDRDREAIQAYKNELAILCDHCGGKIGFRQKCMPLLEGGYVHVKCGLSLWTHVCECGCTSDGETYGEDEPYCENCGEIMKAVTKKVMRASLKRTVTTPAEYDPDMYELSGLD